MNNVLRGCSILRNRILNSCKRTYQTREFLLIECYSSFAGRNLENIMNNWLIKFEKSNIPEANMSTQLIASHVLGVSDLDKLPNLHDRELNDHEITEFNRCGECRLARIPLQYIIKNWDFRDVKLKILPPVFIPRPETELLIDIVADNTNDTRRGLEIGCGSGAISIALLKKFPELCMEAIDQSTAACNLASNNAKLNRVEDRMSIFNSKIEDDGTTLNYKIESPIDFIVSNPPYLFTSELFQLEPEVKLYEDLRALDGGRDGLRVIKAILLLSSSILVQSKKCFMEVHHHHAPMLQNWLENNSHLNLRYIRTFNDYFGRNRFICVAKE